MLLLLLVARLAAAGEPAGMGPIFEDTVLELRWLAVEGHTRPFVVLAEAGPGVLDLDPVGRPAEAAVAEGDRVRLGTTDEGWRVLARDRSPAGCQQPAVGEGQGLAVVRLATLRQAGVHRVAAGMHQRAQPLGLRVVPSSALGQPGIQSPGCPPEGARVAADLAPGERAWLRWVEDHWARVPER